MSDGGKGSSPRPLSVSYKTFSDRWDAIFKKKKEECPECGLKIPNPCKCDTTFKKEQT